MSFLQIMRSDNFIMQGIMGCQYKAITHLDKTALLFHGSCELTLVKSFVGDPLLSVWVDVVSSSSGEVSICSGFFSSSVLDFSWFFLFGAVVGFAVHWWKRLEYDYYIISLGAYIIIFQAILIRMGRFTLKWLEN